MARDTTAHPLPLSQTMLGYTPTCRKFSCFWTKCTSVTSGGRKAGQRWSGDISFNPLPLCHIFWAPKLLSQLLKRELLYPQIMGSTRAEARRTSLKCAQVTRFRGNSLHLLSIHSQGLTEIMVWTHWTHQSGCCYSSSCVKTKADHTVKQSTWISWTVGNCCCRLVLQKKGLLPGHLSANSQCLLASGLHISQGSRPKKLFLAKQEKILQVRSQATQFISTKIPYNYCCAAKTRNMT